MTLLPHFVRLIAELDATYYRLLAHFHQHSTTTRFPLISSTLVTAFCADVSRSWEFFSFYLSKYCPKDKERSRAVALLDARESHTPFRHSQAIHILLGINGLL